MVKVEEKSEAHQAAPLANGIGVREIIDLTLHISFREMVERSAEGCRLLIEPPALAPVNAFSLFDADLIHNIGCAYAKKVLADVNG